MEVYLYGDQTIASNVAISALPRVEHGKGTINFSLLNVGRRIQDSKWTRYWLSPTGEKMILYHHSADNHWLRFPELADFSISADGREIHCYPLGELPAATLQHLLLDQVLPRCLAHQGALVLHASVIWLREGALIILGRSGAGKSTLAAEFHRTNNQVVSDDCVLISEKQSLPVAIPSYTGLRLWEDSYTFLFNPGHVTETMAHYSIKKRLVIANNDLLVYKDGCRVLSVFILVPSSQNINSDITLDPVPLREAFIEIAGATFQLDSFDIEERARQMQRLGILVTSVPVFQLSMPRDYSQLSTVREIILRTVS